MKKDKGSILIFTLWVLVILSILSIVISHRSSADLTLAKYESKNIKAMYLAKAGVMKMLVELSKDTNAYDSLNEEWYKDRDNALEFKIGDNRVLFGASDEDSRLNLNSSLLSKEYLTRLGINETVAQNILSYKNSKLDKGFEFMEELYLVEGMDRETYLSIKDFVTVYTGTERKVNINTAGENVLSAITGNEVLVEEILSYRRGNDGIEGSEDDGIFTDESTIANIRGLDHALFKIISKVFRVWSDAYLTDEQEPLKHVEAIVDRNGKIYQWKEY